MVEIELDTKLRAWGNSYGILIPADMARRLSANEGDRLHVTVRYEPKPTDPDTFTKLPMPKDLDIDSILEEAFEEDAGI